MNTSDIATRLPIFISYGHDDDLHGYQKHEKTVLKIKEALEARGHKIWIDKEGIREGTDWRRKIYDGIRNSQLFLAFVSQKSIDSEYCQTEIRIAVGAPQNLLPICPLMLENVTVPQSISHIQTVNFVYDENDPAAFEEGLKKVTDWIDRDEHVVFCQEMEGLRKMLGNPESFEARMRVLMSQPFVGRKWLLEKLNEWDKGESRLFGIIGGPGFGKSIFAANLRSLAPEKVVAAQFIEWDKTAKYAPKQIIKSLAFQLAARISQYRELLIDAVKEADLDNLDESSLFDKLLSEPLAFENPNNTYWVILDALDEATAQDGQNPFVQTLMRNMDQLPKWLKFIVTSRPVATVVTYLKNRGIQFFDTDAQIRQSQHNDMMEYLHEELKECSFNDEVLKDIIAKSQGMFLYLHFVCQDIKQHKLSAAAISQLPVGLDAIYQQYFDRQFMGDRYAVFTSELRPVLRLYSAALEPLPLDFIAEALGKNEDDVRSTIDRLGTLKTYNSENGRDYFTLVHKSIWDWLAEQPNDSTVQSFKVSPEDGQLRLKDFCVKKISDYRAGQFTKDPNCEYPLKHTIGHLIMLHDWDSIWQLLGDAAPVLFEKQYDYFGHYGFSLDALRAVLQMYVEIYKSSENPERQKDCLLKLAHLNILFSKTNSQQKNYLKRIFKEDNTLEQSLKLMEHLPDTEKYYVIGCYLIGKAHLRNWNIDKLIDAIVKHCGDSVALACYGNFLALGPLRDALPYITSQQLIRLLKVIKGVRQTNILNRLQQDTDLNRADARAISHVLCDYSNSDVSKDTRWFFDTLKQYPAAQRENECSQEVNSRHSSMHDIAKAESLYVHDRCAEARKIINNRIRVLQERPTYVRMEELEAIVDFLVHTGEKQRAFDVVQTYEIKTNRELLKIAAILYKYGNDTDGREHLRRYISKEAFGEMNSDSENSFLLPGASAASVIEDLCKIEDSYLFILASCMSLGETRIADDNEKILSFMLGKDINSMEVKRIRGNSEILEYGPLLHCIELLDLQQLVRLYTKINIPIRAMVYRGGPIFDKIKTVEKIIKLREEAKAKGLDNISERSNRMKDIAQLDNRNIQIEQYVEHASYLFALNLTEELETVLGEIGKIGWNQVQACSGTTRRILQEILGFSGKEHLLKEFSFTNALSHRIGDMLAQLVFDNREKDAYSLFEDAILGIDKEKEQYYVQGTFLESILNTFAQHGQNNRVENLLEKHRMILSSSIAFWTAKRRLLDNYKKGESIPPKFYEVLFGNNPRSYKLLVNWDIYVNQKRHDSNEMLATLPIQIVLEDLSQEASFDYRMLEGISNSVLNSMVPEHDQEVFTAWAWDMLKTMITETVPKPINRQDDTVEMLLKVLRRRPDLLCPNEIIQATSSMLPITRGDSKEIRNKLLEIVITHYLLAGDINQVASVLDNNCNTDGDRANVLLNSISNSSLCKSACSTTSNYSELLSILGKYIEKSNYRDIARAVFVCLKFLATNRNQSVALYLGKGIVNYIWYTDRNNADVFSFKRDITLKWPWLAIFMTLEQCEQTRIQLSYYEMHDSQNIETNWYEKCFEGIQRVDNQVEKQQKLCHLARICIEKQMKEECDTIFKQITNAYLLSSNWRSSCFWEKQHIIPLFKTLKNNDISPEIIRQILCKNIRWDFIDFDDINEMLPYLLNDPKSIKSWFNALAVKMEGDIDFWEHLAKTCPELELTTWFTTFPSQAVIENRRLLEDEEITRKGYKKRIDETLKDVGKETLERYNIIEKRRDNEEISLQEFEDCINAL